jgi:hypothetical protein
MLFPVVPECELNRVRGGVRQSCDPIPEAEEDVLNKLAVAGYTSTLFPVKSRKGTEGKLIKFAFPQLREVGEKLRYPPSKVTSRINPSIGCLVPPPKRVDGVWEFGKKLSMRMGWGKERQVMVDSETGTDFLSKTIFE